MADGTFPSLVSKDANINATTNPIYTQLSDGTAVVGVTGGSLDVNVTNTSIAVTGTVDIGNTVTVTGTVDIGNTVTVTASDLDIRNLNLTDDAVKVSANTTANSGSNPIYVSVVSSGVSTTEVHDYEALTNISAGSTANADYTVTGTTMLLRSVIVSASGNVKFDIKGGPLASLATYATGFLTGREGDTKQIDFEPPIEVPVTSTGTVRVTVTNRQNQAMDAYVTIIGNDI